MNQNPLLQNSDYPQFDKIEAKHVKPAVQTLIVRCDEKLTKLENYTSASWENLIVPLEEIDREIENCWGPVAHLLSVKNSEELRKAYEACQGDIISFGLKLSQSKKVFDGLIALKENESEWDNLSKAQHRAIDNRIKSARLSGIELEGDKKKRFNEVSKELSLLGTKFSNNVLDAVKAFSLVITNKEDMEGMPESYKSMTSQAYNQKEEKDLSTPDNGPWQITLDYPIYIPFMEHCRNRELREKLYRASIAKGSQGAQDNSELIYKILRLRKEKANILKFNTYAELSVEMKMADNVSAVDKLLGDLREASFTHAKKEQADLEKYANSKGFQEKFENWDTHFYAERLREERYDFSDEELRPYFPFPKVLSGLFELTNKLFGITVKDATSKVPTWHSDILFFEVFNEEDSKIASFYLDPYSRPENKRGGAWMNPCVNRGYVKDELKLPSTYLVLNSTPPVGDKPSLLTFREVETLFHEFGHGLQHMLTKISFTDVAGINGVEWDAVELPSQFMENWCYHKPTLLSLTSHIETNEKLPESLFNKICSARTYRAASMMMRQLHLGMIDMELHHRYDIDGKETVFEANERIAEKTLIIQPLKEDRFLCSFSHIFAGGYAAGYYSYKWAEVLSADAYSAFEEAGLDNEAAIIETGKRFKDTVLAKGGGLHPNEIFKEFRGREPKIDALLRHSGLSS